MKEMKILLLLSFFTAVFSQPIKDDDWIESGQMLRFPTSKYFTAVGIGNSEKHASENAVIEVRRQISSTIKSEQMSSEFSISTNNSHQDTSILSMKNKISVVGDIAGVEIIATSTRRNNFYAFAALEKEKFASLQKMKITELQSDLIQINTLANKAISERKIALAISLLNSANEKILAIQSERMLLSAAQKLTDNEEIPVSKAEINGKLAQILGSIKIIAGSANTQSVFAGQIPTEPFSVIATANDQPIENLAVSLFDEKNKKTASSFTDNDGSAYFFLDQNSPSSRGTYKFIAKIDLPGVSGTSNLPTVQFSYSVKTKNLPVLLSLSVTPDLKNGQFAIEQAANEMLSNHGILNDKCGCIKLSVNIADRQKEAIEGLSAARSFTRSDATAQIIVSDNNGKQLYSAVVRNLGAGKDRITAVSDGLRKLQLGAVLADIQNAISGNEEEILNKNTIGKEPKKKIAVFPLKHQNFSGYWYSNSNYEALSTMITTALVNTNAFTVLERQQLETAQSDKKYGGEEEVEEAKMLGANWAVVGSVSKTFDLTEADIRIVDVYSSEIIASVSASGKNIYDFRNIAQKLIDKLEISPPAGVGAGCCK